MVINDGDDVHGVANVHRWWPSYN